jgi:hypothetical protein
MLGVVASQIAQLKALRDEDLQTGKAHFKTVKRPYSKTGFQRVSGSANRRHLSRSPQSLDAWLGVFEELTEDTDR